MRRCILTCALASAWAADCPDDSMTFDYNDVGFADTPTVIGAITAFDLVNGTFQIVCGADALRVQFYREDVARIWLGWSGAFADGGEGIVIASPESSLKPYFEERDEYYEMRPSPDSEISLRASKSPMLLSMYRAGNVVWEETIGLSFNSTASFQTLASAEDEYFFGGGMQNGRFSHKGSRIRLSADCNWEDGGNPNAAPFYLSTAGFGVYRNTWSRGYYDFSESPSILAHNESRFDAFYMVGRHGDFRPVLEGYTYVTGRPFMPPVYALGLGDSDCYHNSRHGNDTHVVVALADAYREADMPGSWFLPNDGYGCGYGVGPEDFPTDIDVLDEVVQELGDRHFAAGLWSSTGLPNWPQEVKGGVRIGKTDVGWIGEGFKYAFDACQDLADGIEQHSDSRRFIWTVSGWAGTHRQAVMWTGDDSGSWEYIRWQIPTYVGCGFSAQAHVSGDIDGIFGGSPETYVRDLQMKSMMTVLMLMSGWATNPDKQPWTWGEPYTSINRMYLNMKMRMTPYTYTLSREAYDSGFPPVRAMALEFPKDNFTFRNSTGTSQQFMLGPWFLVAPVYQPLSTSLVRDGIYLPEGKWVDYWNWDNIVAGPKSVNGYDAPLEKLPMFVKAGAILPLWPQMQYHGEKPVDPLTLEVFPSGRSSFKLYEDDGTTQAALKSTAFATTEITCTAGADALEAGGAVTLAVAGSVGSFQGQLSKRSYDVRVHAPTSPAKVLFASDAGGESTLQQMHSLAELRYARQGWFFVKGLVGAGKGGLVVVKTPSVNTTVGFSLSLSTGAYLVV